ncbi:MAG: LD-carboxypeptidase [Proteobacteria bacterium]|nr:LD-carboxypeptidase [Pseudomonadota bacterium]
MNEHKSGSEKPIKIGIITPSSNWACDVEMKGEKYNGAKSDYTRKVASATLQSRGYEVVGLEKYPMVPPTQSEKLGFVPQSPYSAAAEFIRMVHEDKPDVMWAMDGGAYATNVAQLLDEYASNPTTFLKQHAVDPLTGLQLNYGAGAEKGLEDAKKPLIVGYSDIGNIQISMKKHGFPSMYAPTVGLGHPLDPGYPEPDHKKFAERMRVCTSGISSNKLMDESHGFKGIDSTWGAMLEPTFEQINRFVREKSSGFQIESKHVADSGHSLGGEIWAGSTSIIANSLGTSWEIDFPSDTILMPELMGQVDSKFIDNIDLLADTGKLSNVKAIVFGVVPGEERNKKIAQIKQKAQEYDIPFFILPEEHTFGHFDRDKYDQFVPLLNGQRASITRTSEGIQLDLGDRIIGGLEDTIPSQKRMRNKSGITPISENSSSIEYSLKDLWKLKASSSVDFSGQDLVVNLDEQSCSMGSPEIYLQGIQSAGVFDNTNSIKFVVSDKDPQYLNCLDYFTEQLKTSGRNIGDISVIDLNKIQQLDALDLATMADLSPEVLREAKALGAEITAKPPLHRESKDLEEKSSWVDKSARTNKNNLTPGGSRDI